MEPLAPGTEDEMVDFSSLNKQETEHDRLLNLKVFKNGKHQSVFELSFVNGAEHWFCNVCECPVMGRVYQHELGRRHGLNIAAASSNHGRNKGEGGRENNDGTDDNTRDDLPPTRLDIAPGEPVPPGFEEVDREAQIQERLDGFKVGPLVALEYLIELQDYDPSKEPLYLCILCDKKGDPRTVLTHLASYNHISQYLQKHFPTCYRALAPYMVKQYKRNWQVVLQKIAEAIEKKFGRLRPFCIEQNKFEKERLHYLTLISKGRHFSEQNGGPTFVELVVHEELTKSFDEEGRPVKPQTATFGNKPFIERQPVKQVPPKRDPSPPVVARPTKKPRPAAEEPKKSPEQPKPPAKPTTGGGGGPRGRRRSLSSVSSASEDEQQARGGRRLARNRSPPLRDMRDSGRRLADRPGRGGYNRRRSPSPRRRPTKEDEEERRRNREKEKLQKMEEYTKLSKAIENDIEKTMKQYEKNPEKHPKYNDEWKQFWNRRYKELQAEGKDASKHDFKPEWIEYWGKRMRELSDEELKNRKDGLRKRLGLGEEAPPVCFRIGGGPAGASIPKSSQPKENRPNMPMAARPDNDPEIIFLDDKDDAPSQRKPVPNRNRERERSHSPWESDGSPPRTISKGRRSSRSPLLEKRKGRPTHIRSRERSFERERKRSVERRRSPERGRRSPNRSRRSPSNRSRRSRSRELHMRRSKERILKRSPVMSRDSRDRRFSRSPDSYKGGKRFSREREREYIRERDLRDRDMDMKPVGFPPRERSWERGMRESSFERDVRGRERIRTVAELPWEREKMMYHGPPRMPHDEFYGGPPMMRDISRGPPPLNFVPPPAADEDIDDGDVNIVSVLRLLTALEERLGSLGPKIIDLLAQALALEKKEANSSDTLLDNEINCVMFETVKEKLKGQLLAGLVDPIQERAFKRAIQKTANLIHIASQRKRERVGPVKEAVAVPGVGAVDKAAIARQLANALIAQGKTDVTQAELEQLINAVVGMAEASKGANKPMTAAGFLSQLTGGSSSDPPKEKIIIPRVKQTEENHDKPKERDAIIDLEGLTEPLSPSTPERSTTSNMENLSDSDLQTLLQNFKDLSTEEQMNLINYLKKLEYDEPERVERLRKFVNLGGEKSAKEVADSDRDPSPDRNGRRSQQDDKNVKMHLDSEDEDYSYEDVVKAASKNVKQQEMEDNRKIVEDSIVFSSAQSKLTDAKTLISNLMGSLGGGIVSSSAVNLLGLPISSTTVASSNNITATTSSADFARALSSISMDNLASIVSNVQKQTQESKVNFESPLVENSLSPRERHPSVEDRLPNPLAVEKSASQIIPPIVPQQPLINVGLGPGGPGNLMGSGPPNFTGPRLAMNMGQRPPMNLGAPPAMHGAPLGGPMNSGGLINPGPRPGGPMMMGPRSGPGPFPQRGLGPNQFGNPILMNQRPPRPHFNHNFANPRFGGPRGYNNRW